MKVIQLYPSKLVAIASLLRTSALLGSFAFLISWSNAGLSFSTVGIGLFAFLGLSILAVAQSHGAAFKFELNGENTLRGASLTGIAECPLNEIHNLKITKSLNGEDGRDYGIVEHSHGEFHSIMLNEGQSLKLQRFFVSIAALDPRIKLHLP